MFRGTMPKPLLLLLAALASAPAHAEYRWYPFPVETGHLALSQRPRQDYVPLAKARRPWNLCVSFPHIKDDYWLAVNYGVADEATRLGVRLRLYEAGGYDHPDEQRRQLDACVANGADALVIAAITYNGLNDRIAQWHARGLAIIDLVNGIESSDVDARALVSFRAMGKAAGAYLLQRLPAGQEPVPIAWFPGPEKAGWVEAGDAGFRAALTGTRIRIVTTRYGDTGIAAQSVLVRSVLEQHPEIRYLVGTAVTAEAAVPILRERGLQDRIKILSYYFNQGTYTGIRYGQILAAPTDSPVVQGRLAVDLAVRRLEGETFPAIASPVIRMVDKPGLADFPRLNSLAPGGFRVVFSIN